MQGTEQIARRIINAENAFIETIMNIAGCNKAEAKKVMRLYLKERLAKCDAVIGRITVKHGAYLEADVIRRAIDY